jgi:Ca-activated chloride channel family protein
VLEPLVQEFCAAHHANCAMKYLGSLDIALTLKPEAAPEFDAVWPASSLESFFTELQSFLLKGETQS